ncbi:MAG: hypothetical protein WA040_05560 [Anaerolineae bacterium]
MTEYPSDPQGKQALPSLREMLEGYAVFNAWEAQEQAQTLSQLGTEESLRQYFELCNLTSGLSDANDPVFLEQNAKHWSQLHKRLERLRSITPHGQTTPGAG